MTRKGSQVRVLYGPLLDQEVRHSRRGFLLLGTELWSQTWSQSPLLGAEHLLHRLDSDVNRLDGVSVDEPSHPVVPVTHEVG
jgi:hypothetical protein